METEKSLQRKNETKDLRNEALKEIQLNSAKQNSRAKNWQPKEDVVLKQGIELGLTPSMIADCMNEDDELNYRHYTDRSIVNRKSRLGLTNPVFSDKYRNETILRCKKLLMEEGKSLVDYNNANYMTVKCNKCNHEWERHTLKKRGCPKCKEHNFAGGMPTGPEPALVYLLYYKEIDNYKPGYAEIGKSSSPEEAIHRTSKSRKYPWSYEIVAYDLSTKTNAGIHEQNILKDTWDSRTFIETQEFAGWTEFRTAKTIKYFKIEGKFNTWLK